MKNRRDFLKLAGIAGIAFASGIGVKSLFNKRTNSLVAQVEFLDKVSEEYKKRRNLGEVYFEQVSGLQDMEDFLAREYVMKETPMGSAKITDFFRIGGKYKPFNFNEDIKIHISCFSGDSNKIELDITDDRRTLSDKLNKNRLKQNLPKTISPERNYFFTKRTSMILGLNGAIPSIKDIYEIEESSSYVKERVNEDHIAVHSVLHLRPNKSSLEIFTSGEIVPPYMSTGKNKDSGITLPNTPLPSQYQKFAEMVYEDSGAREFFSK